MKRLALIAALAIAVPSVVAITDVYAAKPKHHRKHHRPSAYTHRRKKHHGRKISKSTRRHRKPTTPTTSPASGTKTAAPTGSSGTSTSSTSNSSSTTPTIKYIAMGKVPVTGLQVGATLYGALVNNAGSQYIVSNLIQGGTQTGGPYNGYDDNGQGACGGVYDDLADKSTWAENGSGGNINAGVLGNLPCGTKLAITYNGHSIIAEKGDISDGGCGSSGCTTHGVVQGIDLWWQTAKALCFWNQPDVMTIHVVPSSTPTTVIPRYNFSDPASIATCN
jgi:hypothetical protein